MTTLNIKETTIEEVKAKWNIKLPLGWKNPIYVKCNSKGKINWDKATVWSVVELQRRGNFKVYGKIKPDNLNRSGDLTLHHLGRRLEFKTCSNDTLGVIPLDISGLPYVLAQQPQIVLRPISDYKEIKGQAMMDLSCDIPTQIEISNYAWGIITYSQLTITAYECLLQNHIQLDEPKGTWISVNELENNPYK